ncbi:MAG: hypothetical protein KA419_06005 [Acidobacteria bacterium]|nr:hypothetical protein [Acidobacteriota bacterium]
MMKPGKEDDAKWLTELSALPALDVSAETARELRYETLTMLRKRTRRLGLAFPAWGPATLRLAARIAGSILGAGWLFCALMRAVQFLGAR